VRGARWSNRGASEPWPSILAFAREFHRREIAEHGYERWPVWRMGLTGNP
jgi:hypothetical protein